MTRDFQGSVSTAGGLAINNSGLTRSDGINTSQIREGKSHSSHNEDKTVLRVKYQATTNRMLRVAVNGFMETLGVVLGVMEELDVDVLSTMG